MNKESHFIYIARRGSYHLISYVGMTFLNHLKRFRPFVHGRQPSRFLARSIGSTPFGV